MSFGKHRDPLRKNPVSHVAHVPFPKYCIHLLTGMMQLLLISKSCGRQSIHSPVCMLCPRQLRLRGIHFPVAGSG